MLALLETAEKPPIRRFHELKRYLQGYRGYETGSLAVLGVPFQRIQIERLDPIGAGDFSRKIGKLAEAFRAQGVHDVLFRCDFPYKALFPRESFHEIDSLYLYETFAEQMVMYAAPPCEDATLAIFCRRVYEREEQAIVHLVRRFRRILITVDAGSEAVCRNIRRQLGIAIIENPTSRQLLQADTALFFVAPRYPVCLSDTCTAVATDGRYFSQVLGGVRVIGAHFHVAQELSEQLPNGYAATPFLSEALKRGTVSSASVAIKEIIIDKTAANLT